MDASHLMDRMFHTLGTLVALAWALHLMVYMHDLSQSEADANDV